MHHPGLVIILLLLVLVLAAPLGQAVAGLGSVVLPLLADAPGAQFFARLPAPALAGLVLLFGVGVVGTLKLVLGT